MRHELMRTRLKIRLAQKSETGRIIEIRNRGFSRLAPLTYTKAEVAALLGDYTEEEFLEMISDSRLFVAVVHGVIGGAAGWSGENIRHVYIDPDYFRLGIGTKLVARVESDYRERTHRDFINADVILYARRFYEKCGYTLIEKAKAWDGSDYYQMRKKLPSCE